MSEIFHQKIQQSLTNPALQAALDGNAERRLVARKTAYASLPEDLEIMRRRAHEARKETIANLDHYLEKFISNLNSNGIIVHYANDAQTARQIVTNILAENNTRTVIKSKTMVGEEIEINPHLEKTGIEVVETDLGEYIVQLRNEPPAHIITPAVHLRREEIAKTFEERLGVPYNPDIPAMTETARQILRQAFLNADAGISGVNFGVADSGTLCLVTNEGNGRMVTTLPRVHVALMGIERIVSNMNDLALMLYLLPRYATGQKLSVYTTLLNGPRRPNDSDGPEQRHLILVDNGRSKIRQSSLKEILYCIRCGACINACPVFREIGGHAYIGKTGESTPYPGPIGSVVSPGLFGQAEFGQLARASSLCGACREACPVDIDLPKLLLRVRAGGIPLESKDSNEADKRAITNAPPWMRLALQVYAWMASSAGRFAKIQRLAGFGGRLIAPKSKWIRLPSFTGWGYNRDIPSPAPVPFRDRFSKLNQSVVSSESQRDTTVSLEISETQETDEIKPATGFANLEQFENELIPLSATFTRSSTKEVSSVVLRILGERGINSIQSWDSNGLPGELLKNLQAAGIQINPAPVENIIAGLTGAIAGIAETGSMLITAGLGKPLAASLLPEIHIAVIEASHIYKDLPEVLNLQAVREASSSVLISGPSRTADIEMTLTIGVHGPRELHVICID